GYFFLRADDALDQRCEPLKRQQHLVSKRVSVINPADTWDHMTETPLSNVGIHAGAAHERASCASQIVQPPAGHAALFVKGGLELAEASDCSPAVGGENEVAVLEAGQGDEELTR